MQGGIDPAVGKQIQASAVIDGRSCSVKTSWPSVLTIIGTLRQANDSNSNDPLALLRWNDKKRVFMDDRQDV